MNYTEIPAGEPRFKVGDLVEFYAYIPVSPDTKYISSVKEFKDMFVRYTGTKHKFLQQNNFQGRIRTVHHFGFYSLEGAPGILHFPDCWIIDRVDTCGRVLERTELDAILSL